MTSERQGHGKQFQLAERTLNPTRHPMKEGSSCCKTVSGVWGRGHVGHKEVFRRNDNGILTEGGASRELVKG